MGWFIRTIGKYRMKVHDSFLGYVPEKVKQRETYEKRKVEVFFYNCEDEFKLNYSFTDFVDIVELPEKSVKPTHRMTGKVQEPFKFTYKVWKGHDNYLPIFTQMLFDWIVKNNYSLGVYVRAYAHLGAKVKSYSLSSKIGAQEIKLMSSENAVLQFIRSVEDIQWLWENCLTFESA